jgi:hypothetical protein
MGTPMNQRLHFYGEPLALIFVGILAISLPLLTYFAITQSITILTIQAARNLENLSYVVLFTVIVGLISTFLGGLRFLSYARKRATAAPEPLPVVVARLLGVRRYYLTLTLAAVVYGIFYAMVSGIIVYRPGENFVQEYLVQVPSVIVSVCCGPVGYLPAFTVYVTNNLGLLIIPSNIILMLVVSYLVGLNAALVTGEYDNRPKSASKRWLAGLGAITGLFTACPTCASLFFASIAGTVGTTAVVSALANSQPLFVAVTLPLLLLAAFLSATNLQKALYGTCEINPKNSA